MIPPSDADERDDAAAPAPPEDEDVREEMESPSSTGDGNGQRPRRRPTRAVESPADAESPPFTELLEYLRRVRGFDFRGYKRASLARRFRKRMQALHIDTHEEYQRYLESHPDEFAHLFNTVLINVTSFFRDGTPWEVLARTAIPTLLSHRSAGAPIRVWSAGCATGEEAYTLAMILAEAMGIDAFRARVKIYATDVDEDALARARAATYTARDVADVPEPLRTRYFEAAEDRYTFRKDLRRAVIFGRNDLIQDAPISKIDLLVSRNTLMYFDVATQRHILARFHFALNDGGYLVLGRAETLLTHTSTFAPVDLKNRVFMKVPRHMPPGGFMRVPELPATETEPRESMAQVRLREGAFESSPIAQVVVNRAGVVSFMNERARALFNLAPSDAGRPLQDLELSYRPTELRSLVDQAYIERQPVTRTDIAWSGPGGDLRWFSLHVGPILEGAAIAGVTLSFMDITSVKRLQQDLEASNRELETAFEELQSTNEELETTNEELQSAVEELETTNEELQSTNEELETMNEELQSTNEELQTINDELRQRSEELNHANAFLESILESLRGGVAVLDTKMRILVWNDQAAELWGVRPEEAIETPFLHLDIGLPVDLLKPSIRSVLLGAVPSVEQRVDAVNRRGKPIECAVTINPLLASSHDGERAVRGVIIVMNEATPNGDE
jgi:two-component system CheB/CheR fusion protein